MNYRSNSSYYDESDDNKSDDEEDINDFWGEVPKDIFGNDDDDDDDDSDDEGVDLRYPGAEHLLVLLDCSPDMFVPCMEIPKPPKPPKQQRLEADDDSKDGNDNDDDNEKKQKMIVVSPVDAVITALQDYVRQTVRTNVSHTNFGGKRNGFGIYLFNTRERERLDLDNFLEMKLGAKYKKHGGGGGLDDGGDNVSLEKKEDRSDSEENEEEEDDDEDDDDGNHFHSNTTDLHQLLPLDVPGLDAIANLCRCTELDPSQKHKQQHERILDLKKEFGHPEESTTTTTTRTDTGKDNSSSNNDAAAAAYAYTSAIKKAFRELPSIFKDAKCVRKKGTKHNNPMIGDDTRTVWIFTSNDDPAPHDNDKRSLETTAKDLKKGGIKLNVWPLPKPNHRRRQQQRFSSDSFFHKIAEVPPQLGGGGHHTDSDDEDGDADADEDNHVDHSFQVVQELMASHAKATRPTYTVPLFFPDEYPRNWNSQMHKVEDDGTTNNTQSPQSQAQAQDSATVVPSSSRTQSSEGGGGGPKKEKVKLRPTIMLNMYLPTSVQRLPSNVKILRAVGVNDDYVELERVSYLQGKDTAAQVGQFIRSSTAEQKKLEKAQSGLSKVGRYVKFKSSEFVKISKAEVDQIKREANLCGDFASLVLLGFRPREDIPITFNLKSYFAFPDDKVVEGSVEAFAHLHQSMIKKNVVGIGELLLRGSFTSKLVSIQAAQEEFRDDDNDGDDDGNNRIPTFPPGWVVTQLPFENEINEMPNDLSTEGGFDVSPEVLKATGDLISHSIMEGFDIMNNSKENPYLRKCWDYLEAKALEKNLPIDDDKKYVIAPPADDEELDELTKFAEDLKLVLPEDPEPEKKSAKRKADALTDWPTEVRLGRANLESFTNDALKEGCVFYGEKKSGKKADLIERLIDAEAEG